MTDPADERTALYRLFNAAGELLYVGISRRPASRWETHRKQRPWWGEVSHKTHEWFSSYEYALEAEEIAIKVERPRYNGSHNHLVPFDSAEWGPIASRVKYAALAERIRSEIISGRWLPGYRIPPFSTLAKASGLSADVVQKAVRLLENEGLLEWRCGEGRYIKPPQ